ncbi:hypothetical protein MMOR_47650 [Mycolicibacterium moriokaense]|uniref:Uncharacterized protein n=1 Tax=Mycolicibacterium moriokaense TaxID=39691 RepID=A0AAD1M8T3_9MYCO|nr:hypothetical protein MMOR_47650 [Mycolicibacterium moriokaense]
MLADPRLVEPEFVHRGDQLEVSLESERRILSDRVEGRHEVSESHPPILDRVPRLSVNFRCGAAKPVRAFEPRRPQ